MESERLLRARDGAPIFCRAWRPGAPRGALVLLHGVASNSSRWAGFCAHSALRSSWTLLRADLRGQGRSAWRGRIGMDEWCADLDALLEAEGLPRAVIGGHCLGANIALEYARREPARAAGLVLIEPMPRAALAGTMRRVARLRPLLADRGEFTDARRVRAAIAALADCEIAALEARHWIPTEQPEAMRAAIDGWIARRFGA